ncbi:MAG TPA: LacI family DNA-binding transcriptional regulator [Anaerolinea sp.]|nr:LacI family DNA-binding transcriptional regulator [Anaerolinea sp.]
MPQKKPTIVDIAREAGVSISTVSRVLNNSMPVADETSRRVRETIDRLQFNPNSAARNLASKRTNTIGLLIPEISGTFFSPMLAGIERCTSEHGYDLLIFVSTKLERHELTHMVPVGEHNTDGLLVFTTSLDDQEVIRLHGHRFPLVLLHRSPPDRLPIPSVTFENKRGTEKLIDHLIEVHGRRKFAFLAGPPLNEDSYWREQGFRASLARHGLEVDPALMGIGEFEGPIAAQAVRKMLDSGARPDAIFAGDDGSAAGVISLLVNRGIRVPDEIAVVGFDDDYMAPYLPVPLTTVRAPIHQAGYQAAQRLVGLLHDQPGNLETILPTELIIRKSCGCN